MLNTGLTNLLVMVTGIFMLGIVFLLLSSISSRAGKVGLFIIKYFVIPVIPALFIALIATSVQEGQGIYLIFSSTHAFLAYGLVILMIFYRKFAMSRILKSPKGLRKKTFLYVLSSLLIFVIISGAMIPNMAAYNRPFFMANAKVGPDGYIYATDSFDIFIVDRYSGFKLVNSYVSVEEVKDFFIVSGKKVVFYNENKLGFISFSRQYPDWVYDIKGYSDVAVGPEHIFVLYPEWLDIIHISGGIIDSYNLTEYNITAFSRIVCPSPIGTFIIGDISIENPMDVIYRIFEEDEEMHTINTTIEGIIIDAFLLWDVLTIVVNKQITESYDISIKDLEVVFLNASTLEYIDSFKLVESAFEKYLGHRVLPDGIVFMTSHSVTALAYDGMKINNYVEHGSEIKDAYYLDDKLIVVSEFGITIIKGKYKKHISLPVHIRGSVFLKSSGELVIYGDYIDLASQSGDAFAIFNIKKEAIITDPILQHIINRIRTAFVIALTIPYAIYLFVVIRVLDPRVKLKVEEELRNALIKGIMKASSSR